MKRCLALPYGCRHHSFTLVEMLVSIAVLSLMIAAMAQMAQLVSDAWGKGSSRIDDFTKGRATLDLVMGDIQRGVFRNDIPSFLTGAQSTYTNGATYFTGGTYTNAFYTRVAGIDSGVSVRDVSLVSYGLNSANQGSDKIVLQRSELPVSWATTGATNIAFGNDAAFTTLTSYASPQNVSPGVVGFQVLFRHQDGSTISASSYTGEDFTHGPIVAVGVGIAVLGKQALAEMSSTQINTLVGQLASPTPSISNSAKSAWDRYFPTIVNQYPKSLGTSLRTFERWAVCQPF